MLLLIEGTCPSSSQQMRTSMLSWLCSGISGSQLWMIWSFIFETIFPSSISNGYLGNLVMMLGPQVFSDNLCLINAQFSSGNRSPGRTGTDRVLTSRHPRRWDRSWVLLVLPHCQLSVIWSPWTYSLLGTELNTLGPYHTLSDCDQGLWALVFQIKAFTLRNFCFVEWCAALPGTALSWTTWKSALSK